LIVGLFLVHGLLLKGDDEFINRYFSRSEAEEALIAILTSLSINSLILTQAWLLWLIKPGNSISVKPFFNFIILDKIFGSQDKIRRQNIMKSLNTLSSKFRQIFLITHVDDVKNDMENIIHVIEDEDGTSLIKIE
jgi:DNA repair exonuclease SbcCD ATPase subunit